MKKAFSLLTPLFVVALGATAVIVYYSQRQTFLKKEKQVSVVEPKQEAGVGRGFGANRNTNNGKVLVTLNSTAQQVMKNQSVKVNVDLTNIGDSEYHLNTGGVDIEFNSNDFDVLNISCNSQFLQNVAKAESKGNTVFITCMSAGGLIKVLAPGSRVNFGSFDLKVKSSALFGNTSVSLVRTLIPNVGDESFLDISKAGDLLNLTILNN